MNIKYIKGSEVPIDCNNYLTLQSRYLSLCLHLVVSSVLLLSEAISGCVIIQLFSFIHRPQLLNFDVYGLPLSIILYVISKFFPSSFSCHICLPNVVWLYSLFLNDALWMPSLSLKDVAVNPIYVSYVLSVMFLTVAW